MTALLLDNASGTTTRLHRRRLDAGVEGYNERWLQQQLAAHPELILLDRPEEAGAVAVLRRELRLGRETGGVYLDILGVTRAGRPVLVECKLWRNPQARREVVAQLLEYASLLHGLSYADLTAKFRQNDAPSANPIFDIARTTWPDLDEAAFVDALTDALRHGDFHLVIAGDGIRSDMRVLADHLNASGLGAARLSLLEVQLWDCGGGHTLIVPQVPLRTEVIQQTAIFTSGGERIRLESLATEAPAPPEAASPARQQRRAFWQAFIDTARFDHPDQPDPRHGGDNWVKIVLPPPLRWLTAYRAGPDDLAVFTYFSEPEAIRLFEEMAERAAALRAESGLDLVFRDSSGEQPRKPSLTVAMPSPASVDDAARLEWLRDTTNRLVTLLRAEASRHENASA